jgi:hypothetical protein
VKEVIAIGIKHGEKSRQNNDYSLTPKGAEQIFRTCLKFANYDLMTVIPCSDTDLAMQCGLIAKSALKSWKPDLFPYPGLNPENVYEKIFSGNLPSFLSELEKIKLAGGTVGHALEISEYARRARKQMTSTIISIAGAHRHPAFMFFSHGCCVELGMPHLPYNIGPADAIIYTIRGKKIVAAKHVPL